ncbi:MAG: hypothetical protein M1824_003250 [Vezdaea acicularis]|nr:MAG: hypothetical protein M1824_003250 [Vezdaea acicularis]
MVREIKELQEQLHQQKQDNKDLERELYWAQQVLGAIVAADRVDVIVAKLQKGHTPESIARELGLTSEEALGMPRRRGSVRGSSVIEESGLDERSNDFSSERRTSWTRVSLDPYLLNQLMQLYFQWIHPVYMLFSKTLFLEGFNTRKGPHCSSALVNAIYAVAADLLDPSTLKALDTRRLIDGIREDFANEARSHLVSEKKTTATTVQTLAVLFLVDSGAGETSQASAYLETALISEDNVEWALYISCVHLPRNQTRRLPSDTNSDSAWSASIYHVPDARRLPAIDPYSEEEPEDDDDNDPWPPEYSQGNALHTIGLYSSTATTRLKLSALVNETNILYYSRANKEITSQKVLLHYRRYLTWREELENQLLPDSNENTGNLPHVLLLHIHFHTAIVHLFQPLTGLRYLHTNDELDPRTICLSNARIGLEVIQGYRRLYTCRRQPREQTFYLVQLCDALVNLSTDSEERSDVMRFCFEALDETHSCSIVAELLQDMFRRMLLDSGKSIPPVTADLMSMKAPKQSINELRDNHPTYRQPLAMIRSRLAQGFEEGWPHAWQEIMSEERGRSKMPIEAVLNRDG